MQFTELTLEEFNDYTAKHFSHFTQTEQNYTQKTDSGIETYLVGVKDADVVKAACLVTLTPVMKVFKYAYTNRGPVLDYSDEAVFKAFFDGLTKFLKPKKVMYLRVDPYEVINKRNHEGEVIESMENDYIFDQFKALGYDHDGFQNGFDPIVQVRWHSVLDLAGKDKKTVFDEMDTLRKRNIKKAEKNGLHIKYLDIDNIEIFSKFMKDTSEMKSFYDRGQSFYVERKRYFKDQVMIPMVYVDLEDYNASIAQDKKKMEKSIKKAERALERDPDNEKNQNKIKNLSEQLENIDAKLTEGEALLKTHGKELPLSSAYFIVTPHEVTYLSGGTDNDFRHFAGSYLIQWTMIQYALDQGIDQYNFYGISGDFTENAEDYGVIQFKKGFNAVVNEYIGDFIKPINAPAYKAYKTLNRLRNK
ncbi:aminoacyltransferase [Jeotgalicoccus halotolerans]|uniref:Aminoacyltransferase FemA n=1 Tax=Jeotgalicoccus halotolerans TaxID=157227 RepID=A0A3E0B0S9_9STAP|nr:aminoacyltransferase [Jeotgalicoccus halotolerans]REG25545.1 peptidoglycan pentaglycine glycine transferase (the second and third glycine) [Jeotgalicoccus halotolerans]